MNIDLSEYFYFFTQVLLLASDLTVCLDFWASIGLSSVDKTRL